MNILMDLRPVAEMSSDELCQHIKALEDRAVAINRSLIAHGQFVASSKMDEAICGLHKTLSCWNNAISWKSLSDGKLERNPCAGADADNGETGGTILK